MGITDKSFEEMTKAELQKVAKLYKVEDKVSELAKKEAEENGASVPKVPTNAQYITVLEGFKDERTEEATAEGIPVAGKPGKVGNAHSSAGKTIKQVKADEAKTKERVEIVDHNNNQTTEEEDEAILVRVSYGNKQGRKHVHVPPRGNASFVQAGAIPVLEQASMPVNLKNKSGSKKRFAVSRTTPVTEAELSQLADEQAAKKVR